jgi:hypothetical protein
MVTALIIIGIVIVSIIIIRTINVARQKKKKDKLQALLGEMNKAIFPNGQADIDAGTNELLNILNYKIDRETAQTIFMRSASICYTTTNMFNNGEGFTKERLKQHLAPYALQHFNSKTLSDFYKYLLSKNEKAKEFHDLLEFSRDFSQKSNPNGTDADEMPEGYGEFGLEITNPIPVASIPDSYAYLNRLVTNSGARITYNRTGSMSAPNIESLIDEYRIFRDGSQIATLYICPYNKKTSTKAPKGFKLTN